MTGEQKSIGKPPPSPNGLSVRELEIQDFAQSIGIVMDIPMLRSVARGQLPLASREIYRAVEDGALYLVHQQQSPEEIRQRFENLRQRQESAGQREVREYLEKEAREQSTDNTERPVWYGPVAG